MKIGKLFALVGLYVEGPSTTSIANVCHMRMDKPPFFCLKHLKPAYNVKDCIPRLVGKTHHSQTVKADKSINIVFIPVNSHWTIPLIVPYIVDVCKRTEM
jgi:hypothetical protein